MRKNLLITGLPGTGKTTLIRRVLDRLPTGVAASGFFTAEIREAGERVGFTVNALDGRTATLAHVRAGGRARVGRYGVDVAGFEGLALPLLEPGKAGLYVIDEIGKMECFSAAFCRMVAALLDSASPVLATVALRGGGFIAGVKTRDDVALFEVTVKNRDRLCDEIARLLQERLR
ncbi:MAG: NTPase [Syntrophaceae bacterium]|nr:NTPase [Syntrophaceae bacterium]